MRQRSLYVFNGDDYIEPSALERHDRVLFLSRNLLALRWWQRVIMRELARCFSVSPELPFLRINLGLRKAAYLPSLTPASIPVHLRITQCHKSQSEVAPIEVL